MIIFSRFFDSADRKQRLSHAKALMELAAADGHVDDTEIDVITEVGLRIGLTDEDIRRLIKHPESIDFKMPEDADQRLLLLYDYVRVMHADGVIDPEELVFCHKTVVKLGFPEEKAEVLIALLSDGVATAKDMDALLAQAKQLIA